MAGTIWKSFGTWMKELRDKAGLSQDGAARRAEIDRQQWYRIENGLSGTKRDTVLRIAHALSADPNEALERAGFTTGQPSERPKPQNVQELLERLRELGVDYDPSFLGGVENLPDDPETLADILDDFALLIRLRIKKRPHNNDGFSSGTGVLR